MERRSPFERVINFPAGLVAVTGILFALALLLVLSFRNNDGQILAFSFTTDNYTSLVQDPLFARILLRSLIIAGLASLATVVLAYPVAYYITFRAGDRRALWLILVTLPFWTSYLLRVFAWKTILGYNGILNSAFVALHIPGAPFETLLYNPGAVVVTLAHAYAAFAILPIFVESQCDRHAPQRSGARSRRAAMDGLPPHHLPAVLPRRRRILHSRLRSDARRLRDAFAGRRQFQPHGRQSHRGSILQPR